MVKPVATWFIIAALALVTTSAQFVGEYVASTSSLNMRASVSDGFMLWEFEGRGEQPVRVKIGYSVQGEPGDYTVEYPNFGRFERLMTSAFPEVQMQDGELTVLSPYDESSFKTQLAEEEVTFSRRALPLVPGTYVYDEDDSFKLILTTSPTDVFLDFECRHASHGRRFSDLIVGGETNIQFSPGADADYASFIRDVAE
ncbi:hypothetical protein FOZ60_000789, partial [Perkinsus olseni]